MRAPGTVLVRSLLCAAVILASWATAGMAAPIAYDIAQGTSGGFQFSFLHSASNTAGMAPFYPAGDKLARVSGMVLGDVTSTTLTINPSVLVLQGLGPAPIGNDVWMMEITGGSFSLSTGSYTGGLLGSFDYVIRRPDTTVYDSGSFYFFDLDFPGPPNFVELSSIHLWGNNWNKDVIDRATFVSQGGVPLGIDLGGGGSGGPTIPEPSAFILAAAAAVALACRGGRWIRRRRSE